MVETYNGWSNRETWAAALWLQNDEGLYCATTEVVASCAALARRQLWTQGRLNRAVADGLKEIINGLICQAEDEVHSSRSALSLARDIGSLRRVEWLEIAEGFLDGIDIEDGENNDEIE